MQNDYKELWCIVNWTNMNHLGEEPKEFTKYYVKPLQQGQKTHASDDEIQLVRLWLKAELHAGNHSETASPAEGL